MSRRLTKSDITVFLIFAILFIAYIVISTIVSIIIEVVNAIIDNWQTVIPIFTFITLLFLLIKKNIKENRDKKDKALEALIFSQHKAMSHSQIDSMNGLDFEHYAAKLMQNEGYSSKVTVGSNDLGVDIIASRDSDKYSVQVKRQKSKVSRRAVSDAVAGMSLYDCNRSMVVTNNYFTPGAIKLAETNSCVLIDRDELIKWNHNFKNREIIQEPATKRPKTIKSFFSSSYYTENKYYLIPIFFLLLFILSQTGWNYYNKEDSQVISYDKVWRLPSDSESATLNNIITKYNIIKYKMLKVKRINVNEYLIACQKDDLNWFYYNIDTVKKKLYYVNTKERWQLKPPD